MKKLFTLALAFAALASCSKVESLETADRIAFGNAFVEVKTRAAVDPSTTTGSINAFDVWAYMDVPSGTVFSKERVTRNGDEWTYANLQYWLADHDYVFYAVSPVDDTNVKVDATGLNEIGLGVLNFTNANGACDVLYTEKRVETPKQLGTMPNVELQFAHLLSKIKFTFVNSFTNINAHLAVKDVVITDAPGEGTIELNTANAAWKLTEGKTTRLEFGDVNDGNAFDLGLENKKECATERLTIPADKTRRYAIQFTLVLYYGDQPAMESHKSVTLEGQAFEMGKHYNLVADINPENFDEDALQPIIFKAAVNDWVEGTIEGGIDWDDNTQPEQPTEPEQPTTPVALATPAVTASVDVNVVTLSWAAVEGAANYSVQVDDDVAETVTGTSYTFTGDYEVEYTFTVIALPDDTEANTVSEAAVVKVTTAAAPAPEGPAAGSKLTVAEFLALKDTTNEFELTGKITRVVNTSYGNFDLTDATGTIYVYGLLTPEGETQKQWAAADLHENDTITIKGIFSEYNGSAQIKNATYISHVAAPFVSAEPITVAAADTTATIAIKSNVAWTVTCDAAWVTSYTQSGVNNGTLDVVLEANTSAENRAATFTFTAEGVEASVVLTQSGAGAVDTKGTYTSEAFMTGGTSTSGKYYAEKVKVNGTEYSCWKLGTSSAVGDYTTKEVGESGDLTLSFYAVGWNGKTSKLNVYLDGVQVGGTITLVSNSGAANSTPYTIAPNDDKDYYSISLTGVTDASKIKFETVSSATRAIIFGVQLY